MTTSSLLSTSSVLVYIPCSSLLEAEHLLDAQQRFRDGSHGTATSINDVVSRIVGALEADPLPTIYSDYLMLLYGGDDYRDIRSIATDLNVSPAQIGAMASKLSARLKKVATASELRDLASPVHLLVSISYMRRTMEASHKLTEPHGRAAVKRFLGLAEQA